MAEPSIGSTLGGYRIESLIGTGESQGAKVLVVAGDTFRAAAVEQLKVWAERAKADFMGRPTGSDAAGLAFDAVEKARAENYDVVLIDTAGRLQTQQNLMQQLTKINRVMAKQIPEAPHEVLLVLDATTGQNGISQAKHFTEAVNCSGIVLAKLDGTAKGGGVVALARRFGLPIHAIGVGETVDDLRAFEAGAFARALLGLETAASG